MWRLLCSTLLITTSTLLLVATARSEEACFDCHDAPILAEHSVHAELDCSDCHTVNLDTHPDEQPAPVDCAGCHDTEVSLYAGSVHGRSLAKNGTGPANCRDCHGAAHQVLNSTDPASPTHHANLATTCGNCHADPDLVRRFGIDVVNPLAAYQASVHAKAVEAGNGGPSCNDCHGSHDTQRNDAADSRIARANVPQTCGKCHGAIAEAYNKSVHGQALQRGVHDAPICTDCHGEHRVLSPRQPGSPVSASNQSLLTCGRCHGDLRLNDKYGLPGDRVPSYTDSFHGLAVRGGATTVASCASCHGVHDILPSSDPASHIHPDHLAETCNQCHLGAGDRFKIGPIHVVQTNAQYPIVYYIRLIYLTLIVGTVGFMLLHVGLDWLRKFREPALRRLATEPAGTGIRMSLGFRIAHGMVMLSFPVLVWSGFALTYPEAWWAWPLTAPGAALRGLVHRSAAVLICFALLCHVIHLVINRQARACILQMVPRFADLVELMHRFAWYLGLRREPPSAPKLGYIEKLEYLAFWWGMIVMAITGLLLWFENFMLRELPAWVPAAMTAIHFYEAILATLAILVWHTYWTIFDPMVYPMDLSWLTGHSPASREWERRTPTNDNQEND